MPTSAETVAIAALSMTGAFAVALVAFRWYEPPARNGETPPAILEAVLFYVAFGIVFALLGGVLSVVAGLAGPVGTAATLLLTPLGFWLAYSAYADRIATMEDDAARFTGVVVGTVAGVYPLVLLVV